MNELIVINYENQNYPSVSGRNLHKALEVKTEYRKWLPRMCEYGFEENKDFKRVSQKCPTLGGVQDTVDHQLSISMAKEICMLQRSEKGKMFRQYFIQIEEEWNKPESVMARALNFAQQTIKNLQITNSQLAIENKEMQPKALFADAVTASEKSILVGELAKILKQNGVKHMGQNRLFNWMREQGYLIKRKGSDYNMPTQRSMEMGLFEIKETAITHSDGSTSVSKTTKVTGKGQVYFVNKFLGVNSQ